MTRKEQIENAAIAYVDAWYTENGLRIEDCPADVAISKEDFIAGAEWADKTMIEKAVEWLKEHIYDYLYEELLEDGDSINDFKQAMEE